MEGLIDTTLLIDCWREQSQPAQAFAFIQKHADRTIGLPWIVKGEYLSGVFFANHDQEKIETFLQRFVLILSDDPTIKIYAQLYTELKRKNNLISLNDLWIAATALRFQCPLITRNTRHFSRVPNLKLINYTQS